MKISLLKKQSHHQEKYEEHIDEGQRERTGSRSPIVGRPISVRKRPRTRGQALIIMALLMTVLILFMGLAVDVGNMLGKKAKLQSAVDSAALSAASVLFSSSSVTQTATNIAYQVIETNGVTSNTLATRSVDFPSSSKYQVHVTATQNVTTYFMRIIPLWTTVQITAEATADLSSYAEITTKPYGVAGVVNELNLMVWGADSWRRGGDAFSAVYGTGSSGLTPNPYYSSQPYGYLYRIDVPAYYPYQYLDVQIFDPDTYNKPAATGTPPPTWPASRSTPGKSPSPTYTPVADQYASCSNPNPDPSGGACTSSNAGADTGMKLNAFSSGRPAFWRVDEIRSKYTDGSIYGIYDSAHATTTQYTLWHFSPHITSAFADPATLSDQTGGAYLSRYTVGWDSSTDLSWYRPPGFEVKLYDDSGNDLFERELNGSMYFYLYVQGTAGSSENNFDLRVGPPDLNSTQLCTTASNCKVNQLYLNFDNDPTNNPDWSDGGASIFAKQSLPLNLDTGSSFPLAFTQVSKNAAGQLLGVRHFDQDCNGGCGSHMQYQMQICSTYCSDPNNLSDPSCWYNMGIGYVSDNDSWTAPADGTFPSGYPDPEYVQIPYESTTAYNTLFGSSGECSTSWLRIQSNPSYSTDTTTWQMPYKRPRLVK